ncbi:Glycosyltransferase involved in cell wall bisynthesis [Geodermatophilus saharensis]|uniref:Glycosyltransferase involved in cell wall bisynthesis n=1 Tax=Geodermatophilus saharensis TaxID=1137994 RepID=A0A239CKS4_9ACTN|nr:glycosyltransferase [Geodermatophilus saharensis]SNS20549.1 Glycosyltransferase involved in cell wall bisynthesis [Geodermatophilus saharensis]
MRVSFVADSDGWGGAEVWLTHHLRRAADAGATASLVCAEPVASGFAHLDVDRTVVPLTRHTAAAPRTRAALAAQRPDVVVVNLVDPASNAAAVAAAQEVAPTAGVLHLVGDTRAGEERAALTGLYRRMAAVVSPSEDGRVQVVADLGVDPARVHVVPNGVDVPPDPAGPAGRPVPRIGAFGRLTAQKGFDVLLAALRRLDVPFDAVVGGAGRDGEALRAAAAGLPVTFPGWVSDARGFLAGLDLFVLSSRVEALPLALLEAMAEGLPCVATDVGDVRRAVGEDAVVVPVEDAGALAAALRGLLTDPARRAALGVRARVRAVRDLDAGLMTARTFRVLSGVAGGAAGNRQR